MRVFTLSLLFICSSWLYAEETDLITELSLEELMKTRITPASLTKTQPNEAPASVTRIDNKMIRASGARSLEELLEIFVPNFQILRHHFAGTNKGFRGLLTDQDDKILLLVNGKVMNHRTFYGADSEFRLSVLGDIHFIDVIRGPGSAIYGPGAISGVINIITLNHQTFNGGDLTLRQGFIEEFTSFELRLGQTFKDDTGLFFYAGGDIYGGADRDDAPAFFGIALAGTPAHHDTGIHWTDDKEAVRDKARYKLHLQYDVAELSLWARYTEGGQRETAIREFSSVDNDDHFVGVGYRQLTLAGELEKELSPFWEMKLLLAYDRYDRYRTIPVLQTSEENTNFNLSEDEINLRLQFNWSVSPQHEIAFGSEYSFENFGRSIHGWPHESPDPPEGDPWQTHTFSLFFEDQYRFNEQWTSFLGTRLDEKHSYTELMWSPRAALIFKANDKDIFKAMYNRSSRRTSDYFLRLEKLATDSESDNTETIDNFELRYERQHTQNLKLALTPFLSYVEIIAYDGSVNSNIPLGELTLYGLEAELEYKSDKWFLLLSHGWTKMHDFDLDNPNATLQGISASPYGYGNNLAHWSNHISKGYLEYEFNKKWQASLSGVYYWGYPGAEDYADYNNDIIQQDNVTRTDGSKKSFASSFFLNSGVQWNATEKCNVQFNAHNILGWIDKDYNKRNYLFLMDTYRLESAAFSVSLQYKL